eukprot:TRINITY_DN91616_c0_g1_i1.p1 TRINITY_DN91616_c0_g1~~TRINITY_DN91616_c0_g1_i1.p1  ORF type:complete len:682 (+),score=171.18 TRINITY_DN91616_c0_g1_i1:60-2048(+)
MTGGRLIVPTAAAAATITAAWTAQEAFLSPQGPSARGASSLLRSSAGATASSPLQDGVDGFMTGAGLSVTAAAVLGAAAAGRRTRSSVQRKAQASKGPEMSQALPFMRVPAHLTNVPTNSAYPGDLGFDPLGFAAETWYLDEVLQNFGVEFNGLRWYRESELMHGRVAMLAVFKVILDSFFPGSLPLEQAQAYSVLEFLQIMTMLEAFRGYRLLADEAKIAGDLGFGGGPQAWQAKGTISEEELAEKTFKELQNGRLAMLAALGMVTQYLVTGQAVGFGESQAAFLTTKAQETALANDVALTVAGAFMALDGVRRLSTAQQDSQSSSIASKAINVTRLAFGNQAPEVALPAGVVAGQAAQRLEVTDEQIRQFEEDGVIMIKGGMKAWVEYLQAVTEHQIENPHVWSLVGRMSGMYDYIQRNMWMTNDGFRDFLYYSPLGHIVSQLARTDEVRCSTDMLLVNPNRGFGWHQDNQNGPIDFPDAIRWWVAMDRCGQDDFGAPEYLLGSHRNESVSGDAVFVNLEDGDLGDFRRKTKFIPEPGDLIVWNARTIHRIVAPPDQKWENGTQRRAIGGTMAKGGATYINKGGASGISDLAGHSQINGEALGGPYFPRIFPSRVEEEEAERAANKIVGRSPKKIVDLGVTLASNASKYVSFTKVVGKKD